jgi:hypothetical protein
MWRESLGPAIAEREATALGSSGGESYRTRDFSDLAPPAQRALTIRGEAARSRPSRCCESAQLAGFALLRPRPPRRRPTANELSRSAIKREVPTNFTRRITTGRYPTDRAIRRDPKLDGTISTARSR